MWREGGNGVCVLNCPLVGGVASEVNGREGVAREGMEAQPRGRVLNEGSAVGRWSTKHPLPRDACIPVRPLVLSMVGLHHASS